MVHIKLQNMAKLTTINSNIVTIRIRPIITPITLNRDDSIGEIPYKVILFVSY